MAIRDGQIIIISRYYEKISRRKYCMYVGEHSIEKKNRRGDGKWGNKVERVPLRTSPPIEMRRAFNTSFRKGIRPD